MLQPPVSKLSWATIGQPAKRHLNGVSLVGRQWPAEKCLLGRYIRTDYLSRLACHDRDNAYSICMKINNGDLLIWNVAVGRLIAGGRPGWWARETRNTLVFGCCRGIVVDLFGILRSLRRCGRSETLPLFLIGVALHVEVEAYI